MVRTVVVVVVVAANVVAVWRGATSLFGIIHIVIILRDVQSFAENAYQIEAADGCSRSRSIAGILIGRSAEEVVGQSTSIRQIGGPRRTPGTQLSEK